MTCNNRYKTIELRMDLEKNKWTYYSPTFEFTKEIPLSIDLSPWGGHSFFAYDLVANTKPDTIVELGTFKGTSFFAFAQAVKDFNLKTQLNAVDTWEGDEHAGFYENDIYYLFKKIKEKYYNNLDIIEHKMLFDDAVKKFKDDSIDILHIDGLHTYEAVKHDFETWLPKVNKDTGIIMFHDVCVKRDDFGVYKLWNELENKYSNIKIIEYHGLGVLSLKKDFFEKDKNNLEKYYNSVEQNIIFKNEINKQEEEMTYIKDFLTERENFISEIDKNLKICISQREELKKEKDRLMADNNNLKQKIDTFAKFEQSKIGKLVRKVYKIKNRL